MFNFFKKKDVEPVIGESREVIKEEYNDILPLSNYFHSETGITFDNHISILKNKVISFCRQKKIASFSKLLKDIKTNSIIKQELIDHLTTNETFFYREFKQIEELVKLVKNSNSKVEILSAPCATGEEPYSIAIALLEAGLSPSSFSIVGIDINSDAISKASIAIYGERNLRKLSSKIINEYFTQVDSKYVLNQNIKSLVSLRVTNLFDSSFKDIGKFDFVFSRNMLIYFDKETKLKAKTILENMRKNKKYNVFFGHADLF
ncbi:MAG: CheR family methyltransferase [Campylobacterota bacterium]|nr:CheR family methyltransferase [Campylobacterota bacterium]